MLYRNYDSSLEQFVDCYWFLSLDDIYRIKAISLSSASPTGRFVEHFTRNVQGQLLLKEFLPKQVLEGMIFDDKALHQALIPPSDRSLYSLWSTLPTEIKLLSNEEAQVQSAFYRKLVMPWLGFLVCIGTVPICTRFRRPVPVFLIYFACLAVIALVYLWISAGSILAQHQVLSPLWTLLIPMITAGIYLEIRWLRMR